MTRIHELHDCENNQTSDIDNDMHVLGLEVD